jgi:hypothetical protein
MPMTGKRDHTHVLSGDAGIRNAAEVVSGLRQALESHTSIGVDTQALTTADITTVQTLIAARISAEAQGKSLSMASPIGEPLSTVLRHAGFLSPSQPHRDFWASLSIQP